jgi:gluconolactonase
VLAASCEGPRLTGPHGVVVQSARAIWCSDTGAGIRGTYLGEKAAQAVPFRVYRLDPVSGALSRAIGDRERPNGRCFSPDETRLDVVATPGGATTTHVYDIVAGKGVNGRRFVDAMPGYVDGIRCDTAGNVWCGFSGAPGQESVAVLAPDAPWLGRMLLPERCANLGFGGRKRNRLCLTASQSVDALYVETRGNPGG